jgi:hypothetical protein
MQSNPSERKDEMFRNVRTAAATFAALAAIGVGASAIATAASNDGSSGATGATGQQGTPRQAASGHGPNETLLTDGTADKVKQAALDKVPGATVLRVETDAQGSPYEAHLRKSDGSLVTVKVDKSFDATSVESGFGPGAPPGGASSY